LIAPQVIGAIDPTGEQLTPEQIALVTSISMLTGGLAAEALGQNVAGAALSAANEALNNATKHPHATVDPSLHEPGMQIETEKDTVPIVQSGAPSVQDQENGDFTVKSGGALPVAMPSGNNGTSVNTAIQTYWPPNAGFFTMPVNPTLEPGSIISRYGGFYDASGNFVDYGNFVAPVDVPYGMRALPPGTDAAKPLSIYQVVSPITNIPRDRHRLGSGNLAWALSISCH
jgi:hypothetical protein